MPYANPYANFPPLFVGKRRDMEGVTHTNNKKCKDITGYNEICKKNTLNPYTDVTQEMRDDALEAFEKYLSI